MSDDIRLHDEDGVILAMFARSYADERSAKAAWERAQKKVRVQDSTSVFRVKRPDGQHVVIVVSDGERMAKRVRERVAFGGEPCDLSDDEIRAAAARLREVAEAGGLQSTTRWGGSGICVDPDGSTGLIDRPQG